MFKVKKITRIHHIKEQLNSKYHNQNITYRKAVTVSSQMETFHPRTRVEDTH